MEKRDASEFTFKPMVVKRNINGIDMSWSGLIKKYGDPELAELLPISLGDVAQSFDSDRAWICINLFPESETKNILHTIFPSVKRGCFRFKKEALLKCLELVENYVFDNGNISIDDLKDANKIIKILINKSLSQYDEAAALGLNYFISGICLPGDEGKLHLTMAPTQMRLFCLDDQKESIRQVQDICAVYPPTKTQFFIPSNA